MGNIYNHNRTPFTFRINRNDCWDFHLSLSPFGVYNSGDGISDECLISWIDMNSCECVWDDEVYSKKDYIWGEAYNKGLELNNIGLTGVDNGLIWYEKDRISNEKFMKLFKESKYKIDEEDLRLRLTKVRGNNQLYDYFNEIVQEKDRFVAKLNGGFYQGFFRSGCVYQVLPSNYEDGFSVEVTLKPEDFINEKYTLNDRHPGNKGMFLYIGTRAENKWWKYYKTDEVFDDINNGYVVDGYTSEQYTDGVKINDQYIKAYEDLYSTDYFSGDYVKDKCDEEKCCCDGVKTDTSDLPVSKGSNLIFTYPEYLNVYEDNAVWFDVDGHLWVENERLTTNRNGGVWSGGKSSRKCSSCDKYFADGYISKDYYDYSCDCSYYFRDNDYLKRDIEIHEEDELLTADGYSVKQPNLRIVKTDNKFLLFDRTCDGFTTDNWVEGSTGEYVEVMTPKMQNYFLLFNRTCNGYTTKNIDSLIATESKWYDVMSDIYRNALGFQIKDDGSIGYKMVVKDCDNGGYKVESEWSSPNAVKKGEWTTAAVKIESFGRNKMRLYLYAGGKLRLISKDLPSLDLRSLNDLESKQEGVPYSISVGGGTQGLGDVIYANYRNLPSKVLPLEKEFAGTFIGLLASVRIYGCGIKFSNISKNALIDVSFLK